jgi:hypothetical protein
VLIVSNNVGVYLLLILNNLLKHYTSFISRVHYSSFLYPYPNVHAINLATLIHRPPQNNYSSNLLNLPTLASSLVSAIPAFLPLPHHADEDYINRSLLDSLDAQADAEPVSSSDSEAAPAATFGSPSNSSSGSPAVAFHLGMQSQQQQSSLPRPHSPTDNSFNNIHHQTVKPSLHNPDALFIHNSQQLSNQNMYSIPSDFSSDDAQKQQSLQMNGFAAPYRSSASFSVFSNSNRQRHPTALGGGPFRNTTSNFSHPYPTTTDVYASGSLSHMTSPTLSQLQPSAHAFESIHHTRGFDYPNTGQQSNGDASLHRKLSYGMADFGNGPSSMLLQSHQVSAGGKSTSQLLPPHSGYSSQTPFQNGVHVQSQTPYGPHLQTNGPITAGGANPINQLNGGPPPNSSQEEISTIFVVGFPEDMQVCVVINSYLFLLTVCICRSANFKTCSRFLLVSKLLHLRSQIKSTMPTAAPRPKRRTLPFVPQQEPTFRNRMLDRTTPTISSPSIKVVSSLTADGMGR